MIRICNHTDDITQIEKLTEQLLFNRLNVVEIKKTFLLKVQVIDDRLLCLAKLSIKNACIIPALTSFYLK